jgi:hypothetical protein
MLMMKGVGGDCYVRVASVLVVNWQYQRISKTIKQNAQTIFTW